MKTTKILLTLVLLLCLLLSACTVPTYKPNTDKGQTGGNDDGNSDDRPACEGHIDDDDDEMCDLCGASIYFTFYLYGFNDIHGVFSDTDDNIGVARLSTYLKKAKDKNTIFLSAGDTWQGSSESNLTGGKIMTEWMNDLGVSAMTLGNHEFDWGEEAIEENAKLANFPFLAINIYDKDTNERVSYAKPSVMVDLGEVQVGIIGAIGNCYSSISGEVSGGFYFKTGSDLTALVKAESERLRAEGADFIVYSLHDGHDVSSSSGYISNNDLSVYYDIELSDGYVDLVFEGHTHKKYIYKDTEGIYHIQGGGYNQSISKVEVSYNMISGRMKPYVSTINASLANTMTPDPIVDTLLAKYNNEIAKADEVLGTLPSGLNSTVLRNLVASLYLEAGMERWGDDYDIVLGGGFLSVRNPYDLDAGEVKYRDLQSIFPFDNEIVLCSVSGKKLLSQFINTDNSNYFVAMSTYGKNITIDPSKTYYIVVDTYTSTYNYNGLTEVARYDSGVYARDLLADYIKKNYN